jgi:hypothetical protein
MNQTQKTKSTYFISIEYDELVEMIQPKHIKQDNDRSMSFNVSAKAWVPVFGAKVDDHEKNNKCRLRAKRIRINANNFEFIENENGEVHPKIILKDSDENENDDTSYIDDSDTDNDEKDDEEDDEDEDEENQKSKVHKFSIRRRKGAAFLRAQGECNMKSYGCKRQYFFCIKKEPKKNQPINVRVKTLYEHSNHQNCQKIFQIRGKKNREEMAKKIMIDSNGSSKMAREKEAAESNSANVPSESCLRTLLKEFKANQFKDKVSTCWIQNLTNKAAELSRSSSNDLKIKGFVQRLEVYIIFLFLN